MRMLTQQDIAIPVQPNKLIVDLQDAKVIYLRLKDSTAMRGMGTVKKIQYVPMIISTSTMLSPTATMTTKLSLIPK